MLRRLSFIVGLSVMVTVAVACTSAVATSTPAATSKPAAAATTAPAPTVAAPTATPAPQIEKGGTLRVAVRCNPGSMIVFKVVNCVLPGFTLYDSLLGFDEKGQVFPELAEKWEVAKDGKSVTFKLRPNLKFHDGTELNAAAVKFNIETLIKEKGFLAGDVADVDSIDVVDNLTAKVNLKAPSSPFLLAMAEQAGFMASPTAAQKFGIDKDFPRNPVGAGAFAFEEWVQDDHVTLKKFDQYWDPSRPYLDKIIFQVIPDASVRTINLRSGTIDHVTEVAPKDLGSLKDSKELTVYQMVGTGWWRLSMNNSKTPYDNKALRQAVAYAINAEPMVKSIWYGYTQAARSPFNPQSWAYNPDFKGVSYDAAKAKAKLAEGGKPDGFEVSLTSYNTEDYRPVIEVIQSQLKEVGIKVTPKLGIAAATTSALMTGDFEMGVSQWTGKMDPDAVFAVYHTKGGYNRQRYSNPKVDDLLEKARQTFDNKERKRFYDEAIPIIVDDASDLVMFYAPVLAASSNKVQNYKLMPGWYFQFETFKDVWLKR